MDDLGDRMKLYESVETDRKLNPLLPIYVRLDGRSFSSFTQSFQKPFDVYLSKIMIETTKTLMKNTHACFGYTQSDEISLVYKSSVPPSEPLFGGKLHKLNSVLPSLAAAAFAKHLLMENTDYISLMQKLPHFDARVLNLPNESETANMIVWRSNDAAKNSISSAAHSIFSHNSLQNKNSEEMIDMMKSVGSNYESFPDIFKYGAFLKSVVVEKSLSHEELMNIPAKYRPVNPFATVKRSDIILLNVKRFADNPDKIKVVFDDESC
jgi:tRNA(His) guanylyltransferase